MSTTKTNGTRWGLLLFTVVVYAVSFFLPAASYPGRMGPITVNGREISEGGMPLPTVNLKGYQAFSHAFTERRVDWFANPALWIGLVLLAFRKWRLCGIAGTAGLSLGLVTVVIFNSPEPELKGTFFVGYWMWLASMFTLAVIGWLGHWHSSTLEREARSAINTA